MASRNPLQIKRLGSLALLLGGLWMAVVWLIYINAHGPTSYDELNTQFGRSTLFWGMMLGGPPNLLLALGLILLKPQLIRPGKGRARAGYFLTLFGLVVPAVIDLAIRAIGPPFFLPILAIGLILLARGGAGNLLQGLDARLLLINGLCLLASMTLWLIPLDLFDQIEGYRIYGVLAHFIPGLVWAWLGLRFLQEKAAA
ncbi:MAG: hypothetical protein EPO32_10760 [Anaerolineae bacterium]|nr:MAG: hypothetical protein EPO32_10760 [Anaerolineae bacterium]